VLPRSSPPRRQSAVVSKFVEEGVGKLLDMVSLSLQPAPLLW
jgi:hypothetical protein